MLLSYLFALVNNGFTEVVRRASVYSDIFLETKPKSCVLQHSRRYRNISAFSTCTVML